MDIYKDCSTLPIYNFYKVINSNDYRYLCKDYDSVKLSEKDNLELSMVLDEILLEYSALTIDERERLKYKRLLKLSNNKRRLAVSTELLRLFKLIPSNGIIDSLKTQGFHINVKNNTIQSQIDIIEHKLEALEMNIKIDQLGYDKQYESKEKKVSDLELESLAIDLERVLNLKYNLDTRILSVLKWVSLLNKAKSLKKT